MSNRPFNDPAVAQSWDADTTTLNPSRPEQLDMLLTIIADYYQPQKTILDLGIGTGLVEELLFKRIQQAQLVGVDGSPAMLEFAYKRLQPYAGQYTIIVHDFTAIATLQLPPRDYQMIFSVQTLHHLTDEQMLAAYQFTYNTLEAGGLFLLLDRIAVENEALYGLYQTLWKRQDALYHSQVAEAEGATFADYQRNL
nr:class I SAM-dependent methyltransferase [Anaerolineae bacterium]